MTVVVDAERQAAKRVREDSEEDDESSKTLVAKHNVEVMSQPELLGRNEILNFENICKKMLTRLSCCVEQAEGLEQQVRSMSMIAAAGRGLATDPEAGRGRGAPVPQPREVGANVGTGRGRAAPTPPRPTSLMTGCASVALPM